MAQIPAAAPPIVTIACSLSRPSALSHMQTQYKSARAGKVRSRGLHSTMNHIHHEINRDLAL